MQLHRSDIPGTNFVRFQSESEYFINDVLYTRSIIVSADRIVDDWTPRSVAELTLDDFQMLAEFDAEIVILGTGRTLEFPSPALFAPLIEQKCGYEVMSSHSACNTFNILLGDERKVVGAILIE